MSVLDFVASFSLTDNADQQERLALIRELETLIHVGRHPNIVSLVGACTFEGKTKAYASFEELIFTPRVYDKVYQVFP